MSGATSKIISTWSDKILNQHSSTLTHGNSVKTRVLVVSKGLTKVNKDEQVIKDVLEKDSKTNKVLWDVLKLSDYCKNLKPYSYDCSFKNENKKTEFLEYIKYFFRPTIILFNPKYKEIYNVLMENRLLGKSLIDSEDYNIYSTHNITTAEPVIFTFTVPCTWPNLGNILKGKLKKNRKTIPNDPNTRVLWIDGGHGRRFKNDQKKYEAVGGMSGLSDETNLNSKFYKDACKSVGIQPNTSQFDSIKEEIKKGKPKKGKGKKEKGKIEKKPGDFISWLSLTFPRPDIYLDPMPESPLPEKSFLNDPELNEMTYRVLNVADFHNTPDLRGVDPDTVRKRRKEFLEAVKRYNPTVIFIGWCYSANGDVALALRGSPVLSLMLLKDDLRNISGVATAELDPEQIEIIQRLSEGDIRHCVFSGSSGTGKSYMCAEFGKILAAILLNEIIGIQLEIVVCRLWAGDVEEALLYQVWREKYFPGVEGFNVTYLDVFDMCERFGVVYKEYIKNDKSDIVGLITAVCEKCDSDNCAKNDESRTIFLLDEAVMESKDGVCDYSPLADLCRLKTVYTATCLNPQQLGGDEFTVKLPVACPVPCDKGHSHGCTLSAQLLNCYRNTEEIRQVLRFWSDHRVGLLSHKSDKLGANLPPGLAGQHSAVTWVQCHSQENMEKAARDTLHMLENNNEKDVQILYDDDDVVASAVVTNVKDNYKAVHYMNYFGCEADHIVYVCNKAIYHEVLSRPRRGLIVITGPDLLPGQQLLMKALAGDHHSETSRGRVKCRNKPCPWSCGHVSPVAHHVSLVAHTVSSPCGWTPLVEHAVVCGACGHIMERARDKCQQCREKSLESGVAARAAVKQKLKPFIKTIMNCSVTDKDVEDLLGIDAVVDVTQQLFTALEGDNKELTLTLLKQFEDLITANSPSIARAAVRSAVKPKLKHFMETIMKTPVTEGELEYLLVSDEIVRGTQEWDKSVENGDDEDLQSNLSKPLAEIITTNLLMARAAARPTLKLVLETVKKTTVTDEELDDLLTNDDIFNVTQQLKTAFANKEKDQQLPLATQLIGLVNTHSTGGGGPAQGAAEAANGGIM